MRCEELGSAAEVGVSGIVFDTQRFSIHDGHGIRTLIFLKGCPLKCEWCTNPESQSFKPQPAFFAEKCAGCMKCADVCPCGQTFRESGRVAWESCAACLKCADVCLYEARLAYGKRMNVEDVMNIARRDKVFFKKSGGGVTLGGGEATSQPAFAREILRKCREEGIHTALETCGFAPWEAFKSVIEHVCLLLFDFKHMDSAAHKSKTGVTNELILDNAVKAAAMVGEMVVRFPMMPGFNDGEENVRKMGAFIRDNMPKVKRIDILRYHSVGESKHERLGKEYLFRPENELSDETVNAAKAILETFGLSVSIGG